MTREEQTQTIMITVEKGKNGAPDETTYDVLWEDGEDADDIAVSVLSQRHLDDVRRELGPKVHADQALVMAGWDIKENPVGATRWGNIRLNELTFILEKHLGITVTLQEVTVHGHEDIDDATMEFDACNLSEAADNWNTVIERVLDLVPGSRIGTGGPLDKVMWALDELQQAHCCLDRVPTTATREARQPLLLPFQGVPAVRKHRRS